MLKNLDQCFLTYSYSYGIDSIILPIYINALQGNNQNQKQNINTSNREKVLNNDIPTFFERVRHPFSF